MCKATAFCVQACLFFGLLYLLIVFHILVGMKGVFLSLCIPSFPYLHDLILFISSSFHLWKICFSSSDGCIMDISESIPMLNRPINCNIYAILSLFNFFIIYFSFYKNELPWIQQALILVWMDPYQAGNIFCVVA